MDGIKNISKTLLSKVSTKGIKISFYEGISALVWIVSHSRFLKKYTWYHAQYIDENVKVERERQKEISNELYIFLFADFRGPWAA